MNIGNTLGARTPTQTTVPKASDPFLTLVENRFAHTAVTRLSRRKSTAANPLVYLYGPAGSGKSHLVRMFLHEASSSRSRRRVAQLTAAELAAGLAEASADKRIHSFREQFDRLDLFVCEDIASLRNRYESQRFLVSVLDGVLANGGSCLLTSRLAPAEVEGLLARLVNRSHGGVCAAIEMPGTQSRRRLVAHFSQQLQLPLTAAAIALIADELTVSPRELLATVVQIEARARLQSQTVDEQLIRHYLDGEVKTQTPTLSEIARAVARHFDVRVSEMRKSNRLRDQVLPRQYAMLLARQLTDESLGSIARYFGRRNHSTVVHACHRIEKLMADKPALRQHLTRIRHYLGVSHVQKRR